ncbi:MAG: aminotransferase class V-fold PLP-dependent enzyme [Rhodothermales bacterium]
MSSPYAEDFGPFDGHIWLNCAHQGPIPKITAKAAAEAVSWKRTPFELTVERFSGVPQKLKEALGRLINAPVEEVILANSASYGLHLLANGLPLQAGDEILLTEGDFPSVILPWLGLEKKGITIRFIKPRNQVLEPQELADAISSKTKLFCATWVHSFSGRAIDLESLGSICKEHGVLFIANTTQAIGARPFDSRTLPVDAITNVGFKWLCGPYGTGFCWIRKSVLETLTYNQTYWLSMQTSDDLGKPQQVATLPDSLPTSKTYDVFGTANFFNYVPWEASLSYLLDIGIDNICRHDQDLVQHLIDNLPASKYMLLSPPSGLARSTLTLVSHHDADKNQEIYDALKRHKLHVAFRRGNLRIAPHLYNSEADINQILALLDRLG